ncbi:MAG: acyl-CoA thioesterase [Solirubrobacterales bacterium]|nr:acyl-CoA thioesterase [Solirubrobacterales bacterium]MCB8969627.1 acyl-CoA thioesterase [Thermoleophilales bacterium]
MSGAVLSHSLRVRFAECDPQSVVFNSRYLEYFDVALTELWREALGNYDAVMADAGLDLVVAEASVRYRAPLRFDDIFEMRAVISRLGTTSTVTSITILRDGEITTEGDLRHVFVRRDTGEKAEIPAGIKTALAAYAPSGT